MEQAEQYAEKTLRDIGVQKGQSVLDCCCGSGRYAIAAAKLVGDRDIVYAVDKDSQRLDQLRESVRSGQIHNIKIIRADVESQIPLSDRTVDVVLLYDVFWYFRPGGNSMIHLIQEVYRVAEIDALISVYPTHVSSDEMILFKDEMGKRDLEFENEYSERLIHEGRIENGTVLNFRKTGKRQRIVELERRIADLKARLPIHSVPPSMIQELEDLEEELAWRKRKECS
jgi:ubiquinone/menaquinone biosynthesis C-methylase UbiE